MSKLKPSMNLLLLLLLISIFVAYYFYIFLPLGVKIIKLESDHKIDTATINMIRPYQKDDSPLKSKKEQLLKDFDSNDISKKLASASTLASEIKAASTYSGIKPSDIVVTDPVISQKQAESNPTLYYSSVEFSVKFTGDYNAGKQFLSFFENNQNANVIVQSVDITPNAKVYDFNIKLILNYFGK